MKELFDFLDLLESRKIYFTLSRIRDSVLVEVSVPGERWEVEFFADGSVQVEKFKSEGIIYDGSELNVLFAEHSN
mgnify:CR=1 FL=1|jgi:hypothetical protein